MVRSHFCGKALWRASTRPRKNGTNLSRRRVPTHRNLFTKVHQKKHLNSSKQRPKKYHLGGESIHGALNHPQVIVGQDVPDDLSVKHCRALEQAKRSLRVWRRTTPRPIHIAIIVLCWTGFWDEPSVLRKVMRTSPSPPKKSMLCFAAFFDVQTNLDRSITVLPTKSLKAERRDDFSKTVQKACGNQSVNSQRTSTRKRV